MIEGCHASHRRPDPPRFEHRTGGGPVLGIGTGREHGEHEWTVADPWPPAPAALPDDPTVRELMDHEPGWARFVATAVEAELAPDEPGVARALSRYLDQPVDAAVTALTWGDTRSGGEALRACLGTE